VSVDPIERARNAYDAKLRGLYRFRPTIVGGSPLGVKAQPVDEIHWVRRDQVRANDYNPNFVAPPELKLLKVSILSDGWTQPIVARRVDDGYEVIDGFHRWLVSGDPDVLALTDGFVPLSVVADKRLEDRMMSTIRHNRARGSHHVLKMADIVAAMLDNGVPKERVAESLQMDEEEIDRMYDHGDMLKRGAEDEFNKGWVPG
jgi:ParB-like chromosome segregation protein Spo0J